MPDFIDYELETPDMPSAGDIIIASVEAMEDQVLPVVQAKLEVLDPDKAKDALVLTTIPYMRVLFAAAAVVGAVRGAMDRDETSITWDELGPLLINLEARVLDAQALGTEQTDEEASGEETPSNEAPATPEGE
jgi:hypothetical protein